MVDNQNTGEDVYNMQPPPLENITLTSPEPPATPEVKPIGNPDQLLYEANKQALDGNTDKLRSMAEEAANRQDFKTAKELSALAFKTMELHAIENQINSMGSLERTLGFLNNRVGELAGAVAKPENNLNF